MVHHCNCCHRCDWNWHATVTAAAGVIRIGICCLRQTLPPLAGVNWHTATAATGAVDPMDQLSAGSGLLRFL